MLSILQILKKHQQQAKDPQPAAGNGQAQGKPSSGQSPISFAAAPKCGTAESAMSIAAAINKEDEQESQIHAKELYGRLLTLARAIYRADIQPGSVLKEQVIAAVDNMVVALLSPSKDLLRMCLVDYSPGQPYVANHALNTAILSVELGLGLKMPKPLLVELGVSALLHEVGMVFYLDLAEKNTVLTKEEYDRLKEHPSRGIEALTKLGGEFCNGIVDCITQEHERIDGSGYPKGLQHGDLSEYARILGLADVYEAMTHSRPYRKRLSPSETMHHILNNKSAFETRIKKILVERIGIFPLGCVVKLNTKETGIVFKNNTAVPLRPVINIILDSSDRPLQQPKQIDLVSYPLVYIEECLENMKKNAHK